MKVDTSVHNPLPESLAAECNKAASILSHFIKGKNQMDSTLIPPKILQNAKGIAVITILKAGFVWSGRAGSGLVVAKLPDGRWSAPCAIATAGAGFGAQIGAQLTDCVFILNTADAVKAFSHGGNVTLGGNLSVAAGPVGRSTEAAGAVMNLAPVYSYSKTKGLFAGLSLEGSVIITRGDANAKFYNRKVSAKELLSGVVEPPAVADPLYRALNMRFGSFASAASMATDGFHAPAQGYGDYAAPAVSPSFSEPKSPHGVPPPYSGGDTNNNPYTTYHRSGSLYGSSHRSSGAYGSDPNMEKPIAASAEQSIGSSHSSITKRPPPPVPRSTKPRMAVALFPFAAERDGDLSFQKGDLIEIVRASGSHDDWWTGRLNGVEGIFPANYVQMS